MENKLSKKSLIKADREALNEILEKDAGELIDEEIATIKARINYLNSDEKRRFASVLVVTKAKVEKQLDKMNRAELTDKASEFGLTEEDLEGKTNKEVVALIEANQ